MAYGNSWRVGGYLRSPRTASSQSKWDSITCKGTPCNREILINSLRSINVPARSGAGCSEGWALYLSSQTAVDIEFSDLA